MEEAGPSEKPKRVKQEVKKEKMTGKGSQNRPIVVSDVSLCSDPLLFSSLILYMRSAHELIDTVR